MTQLAAGLSKAINSGRILWSPPNPREQLLVSLLKKRAVARASGAEQNEIYLRSQILWSLPMIKIA